MLPWLEYAERLEGGVVDSLARNEHHAIEHPGNEGLGGVQHLPSIVRHPQRLDFDGDELSARANPLEERGMTCFQARIQKCLDDLRD